MTQPVSADRQVHELMSFWRLAGAYRCGRCIICENGVRDARKIREHHRWIRISIGAGFVTAFALCSASPRLWSGEQSLLLDPWKDENVFYNRIAADQS
jgi:hypothetical protein